VSVVNGPNTDKKNPGVYTEEIIRGQFKSLLLVFFGGRDKSNKYYRIALRDG